jgi:hypothetical protein
VLVIKEQAQKVEIKEVRIVAWECLFEACGRLVARIAFFWCLQLAQQVR